MKHTICIFLLLLFLSPSFAQSVEGDWYGILEVQGTKLNLVFHIQNEAGTLVSTMDSPDQGAKGIPMDETILMEGNLTIKAAKLQMVFEGLVGEGAKMIHGDFKQAGYSFPLELSRKKIGKKINPRPQEPKNFPYLQEDISFRNPANSQTIVGTLTKPDAFDQVVVLVNGSGPQDRNSDLGPLNHRPFLVLSDYLTRQGIAVFRYDERGVGESTGDYHRAHTGDLADDAHAVVHFLSKRPDLKEKKIGILGHSEGGMIAPIVAAKYESVDFIGLLAGPGIPIQELMLIQSDRSALAEGVSPEQRKVNQSIVKEAYEFLNQSEGLDFNQKRNALTTIFSDGYDRFPNEIQKEIGDKEKFIGGQLGTILNPWFSYFIQQDPTKNLQKVKCPVLAINGSLDVQVTAKENLKGIKKSLKKAKNKKVTIKMFSGLNHLFQKAETGAFSEYSKIEETFNEEVMEYISNWVKKQ